MNLFKKTILASSLILSVSLSAWAQEFSETLVGKWKYYAEGAPYEYQEGTIHLRQKGKTLQGKFLDREFVNFETVKDGNKTVYSYTFYLDNSEIVLKLTPKGKALEGVAVVDGYSEMPLTFKRPQ